MPNINFVLDLPPKKAIEWLKTKKMTAENYRNLTESEIAKVYTIAKMTDLDMLQDIKSSLIAAAEQGKPFAAWKKDLLQHLANKGWLHPNGHNGKDIIDPKTGEIFGSATDIGIHSIPRRWRISTAPICRLLITQGNIKPIWLMWIIALIGNMTQWATTAHAPHTQQWTAWCIAMMTHFGQRFIRPMAIVAVAA